MGESKPESERDSLVSKNEKKVMALMALAANFGKEFPECLLPIWLDLLEPYPASLVNEAVKQVILTYEYKTIPPFAVLKGVLDKITGQVAEEDGIALAAEAEWNKLLADISSRGYYKPPEFCPTTAFVLRSMGGWEAACSWSSQKMEWRHKEFLELWKQAHGKEEIMELGGNAVLAICRVHTPVPIASVGKEQMKALESLRQKNTHPESMCHAIAE